MAKIGFIGMGNMGYAILKGLLNVYGNWSFLCGLQCRMCSFG